MRIGLLYNPHARGGRRRAGAEALAAALGSHGEVFVTEDFEELDAALGRIHGESMSWLPTGEPAWADWVLPGNVIAI